MQNVAFFILFCQTPSCFTSDELGCYLAFVVFFPSFSSVPPPPPPVGCCWPNQTGLKPRILARLNPRPCSVAEPKALVSVNPILLLLCVFAYLTAELPLIVLYLSLPLRKLLQCLWLSCNSECVFVAVGLRLIQEPPERNS